MKKIGLKVIKGDEAFCFLHQDGDLMGAVITHGDDFTLAGTEEFINKVLEVVTNELTVSKVEKDKFRYTGIDVCATDDGIEIKMEDFVESLEEVGEIRVADRDEYLTQLELRLYRKMANWLGLQMVLVQD